MIDLIELRRKELNEACKKFNVERLYVFGSATDGRFNPAVSDVDFLVTLADRQPTGKYADRYLGLAESLENIFGRRVDLLSEYSVRNPLLMAHIRKTRQLVYEQPNASTPR